MPKKTKLDPTQQQASILKQGLTEPFWLTFKKLLEDEKREAEMAIFDEEGVFNDTQREDFRLRRNLLAYVIELPDLVIAKAEPKQPQEEPDFEAYDTPNGDN